MTPPNTINLVPLYEPNHPNTPSPNPAPHGTDCGIPITSTSDVFNGITQVDNETTSPSLTGRYSTGVNIAGTFNYPVEIDPAGDFKSTRFNINYDSDYQGVQSLATLAGTYAGTVATSQYLEAATFTFGPASVSANLGDFGVGIVSGTGASGCTYTGTVSPLFKGNGYTLELISGGSPCLMPTMQFSGLVYLNTTTGNLYSFLPNAARTDGLIFTGQRI